MPRVSTRKTDVRLGFGGGSANLGALALAASIVGCSGGPGHVQPDFASAWGCNADSVAALGATVNKDVKPGYRLIPQPRWTACQLLAAEGQPDKVDYVTLAGSARSATWWWSYGSSAHMVTLQEAEDGGWRVQSAVW
jgi:hypothetical protein